MLRRLGEPEAIAAAASDSAGDFAGACAQPGAAITQPPAGRRLRRQRRLDVAAVMLLLLSPRWPRRAKVLGAVTGTLALPLFGGLLATLAKTWYWQQAGPFGWQSGTGPFISSILVGVRLLRYPLSQPAGPGPATPEGRTATGPAAAAASEPATPARAGR